MRICIYELKYIHICVHIMRLHAITSIPNVINKSISNQSYTTYHTHTCTYVHMNLPRSHACDEINSLGICNTSHLLAIAYST